MEQTILPPVGWSAERAALSVGSSAGSGLLICWNRLGIWRRSDVMTDLVHIVSFGQDIINFRHTYFDS